VDTITKLPKNHEFILDVLKQHGAGKHLDTSDILSLARQTQPRYSNATLYRALRRLADEGLVSEVTLPGAAAVSYELAGEEHAHFQCSRCRRVIDMPFTLNATALRKLAHDQHVDIDGATISFTGRCAECA
jgi:Fe2+ or Zn2+ uptake regulation protein